MAHGSSNSVSAKDFLARRNERKLAKERKIARRLKESGERRTEPSEPREKPLPAPRPLTVVEEFRPHVQVVVFPDHAPHYRTTMMGDTPADMAYVEVMTAEQVTCQHFFDDLTRWGSGECAKCQAQAFSRWWVADQWQGDDTRRNAAAEEARWRAGETPRLRASVVAVEFDLEATAKRLTGRRGSVPSMASVTPIESRRQRITGLDRS